MLIYLLREILELRVVEWGRFEFIDKDGNPKDVDDMTNTELTRLDYNGSARKTLMNGLCHNECENVSSCTTIKEIWIH